MKKVFFVFILTCIYSSSLFAQINRGAKIITLSQFANGAIENGGNTRLLIQMGLPILGRNENNGNARLLNPLDVRNPWDILYLSNTFSEDYFTISKGYYGDKVKIEWELKNNTTGQSAVTGIKIYRRVYNQNNPNNWGQPIVNLSAAATNYEDKYIEGGVLYEYKVYATGVNNVEQIYKNYITGIGFRNPTAIVTGNVNFKGGNPVKDVVLMATSNSGTSNVNKSLKIPLGSKLAIVNASGNNIDSAATLEAWVKPFTAYANDNGTAINLFKLFSSSNINNYFSTTVNYKATAKVIEINIGGTLFKLNNYFPSGNTNTRGDDELIPVSQFNTRFTHIAAVLKNGKVPTLYVNGRPISVKYGNDVDSVTKASKDISYTAPYFSVQITGAQNISTISSHNWDNVNVGGGNDAIVDEIRVFRKALDTTTIRTDFKRYISGNNTSLISYLNLNEGTGSYGYDLSKNGFDFNDNNGKLDQSIIWLSGEGNVPSPDQLGILGVTDEKGNYEITNIPYTGVGESYTITPMFGQHKFESKQQLVYLGQGSEVANKIDFIDVSSFSFKGLAMYDSRGVFPSFVDVVNGNLSLLQENDQYVLPPFLDEGYNYFQKNGVKYYKGEYWLNATANRLERYARIYVKSANVYVDGNIVLDENNMPVVTDDEGKFDVSVPIGNHAVTVKKDGHSFLYNGRFPGTPGTFKEFFENSEEPVVFVDTTKITVVGKVVGGAVEAAKKIGFGQNGFLFKTIEDSATGQNKIVEISAKNNIGIATLTLGYKAGGMDAVPTTKTIFGTNSSSGEYRVKLLPLLYELQASNLKVVNNLTLSIIPANTTESLDFTNVLATTTPVFKYKEKPNADSVVYATGSPYHYERSYIYRSTPVLQVLKQTSDLSVNVNGVDMPVATNPDRFVYTQFGNYQIDLKRYEHYVNNDSTVVKLSDVPVSDGQLMETNNLAILNSSIVATDTANPSILHYTFKAGIPNIAPPFTKTISLRYRVNGVDYNVVGLKSQGIILGGASDGSQTFVTQAPDLPAIILRDPPGSNSSAQITQGTSFSVNSGYSLANSVYAEMHTITNLGFKTTISGGMVPIPEQEIEVSSNSDVGTSLKVSSSDGKSVTSTYTFNKTISTSDQTDYVGSDGDLYIGNSKNIYYGSYDNIQPTTSIPKIFVNGQSTEMSAGDYTNIGAVDKPIYISKQKALSFVEKPTSTFFMYSQKHILTTLIPEYQTFINTSLNSGSPDTTKIKQYREQIRIWRAVILDNEKKKYLAKNYRSRYKTSLTYAANRYATELKKAYSGDIDIVGKAIIDSKLNYTDSVKNKLDASFEKNISFDAGLGQYDESVETSVLSSSNFTYNVNFDHSIEEEIGVKINDNGASLKVKGGFDLEGGLSLTQENQKNTNIGFTIKDNDNANYLSVDVINAFDGNGPIFSTLGGRTSCPYEGSETSKFFPEQKFRDYYNAYFALQDAITNINNEFDNISTSIGRRITLLNSKIAKVAELQKLDSAFASDFDTYADSEKASLGFATQKVEVPVLSVTNDNVTNVSEGKNAEFELKFNNNSAAQVDATYRLRIDNTTNPNNAIINIDKNGTIVNVPYGKTTVYKMTLAKSISDVYEYDNIRVILESLCDGEAVSSSVLVSAKFVPSCSSVNVTVPASNWVFNRDAAYNLDKTTNPMIVNLTGYNTSFANFKQIDLEYRLAGTPNWTRLKTFYNGQAYYDASPFKTDIATIGNATSLNYAFNMAQRELLDGNYEIRARSSCINQTEFISDLNIGKLDLNAPQKFGTPTPVDGILRAGEDLKVTFNEPIAYNTAVSLVEIKGQTNQMKIDHNVSIYMEGAKNTVTIDNPKIANGDITIEFWMKNTGFSDATIVQQKDGLQIKIVSGKLVFSIAGVNASGTLPTDNLFHHFTFVYNQTTGGVSVYVDDKTLASVSGPARYPIANNETMIIGGNNFAGNIHDYRIWNKPVSITDAYAKMYNKLSGSEANLVGYWPLNEGAGLIAYDMARYKHAVLNSNMWDIKPRGTSYAFVNGQYLKMDHVANAVITNEMDATIAFWMKTGTAATQTLISNGRGDGTDVLQGSLANKWAVQLNQNGSLILNSEGTKYTLASNNLADNSWHHVALLFNRQGALKTFVDAQEVSSNAITQIGGFSGNRLWIGARGHQDLAGVEAVDQKYTGNIDEVQIWNTLRSEDQVFRDRYFEIAPSTTGLLFYSRLNQPDITENVTNTDGPLYYVYSSDGPAPFRALLSSGTTVYTNDAPAIKPERALINFAVNRVISGNEMIISPNVTDAASIEGQTLDITVNRMFDGANNMQQSPITWTAYYRRNDVVWYADGYNDAVDIIKYVGETKSFDIVLLNKGGVKRNYTISNIPRWISLSSTTGTIAPNSKLVITATIDKDYATGEFIENMSLSSDFGYDEKLQVKLRVLAKAPDWNVTPTNFNYSLNIIGRLKLNGVYSNDIYNALAAFKNDTVVGVAKMEYNDTYKQYFMYLTVYSNTPSKDLITFKVWDATEGKIKELTFDGALSLSFIDNDVFGSPASPVIFENTTLVEQDISINKGWTWISMFVNDPNFKNLNNLTSKLNLATGDRIINGSSQEIYSKNIVPYTWSGSISSNGGLSTSKMYKLYIANPQTLNIKGTYIDLATWSYPVNLNWNWFPYPLPFNRLTVDAMAYFDATNGDLIKSQTQFAIYDAKLGWSGSLKYLEPGKGYMLKSAKAQTFSFPTYLTKTLSDNKSAPKDSIWKIGQTSNVIATNAASNMSSSAFISVSEGKVLANEVVIKDFSKYTQNMNAIVKMPQGYSELQVFDDQDQLKGIAKSEASDGLTYITIFGDKPQNLYFYVNDGAAVKKSSYVSSFTTNGILGTVNDPVILNFDNDNTIRTYPNPFATEFSLQINSNKNQKAVVSVFSISSQMLYNQEIELFKGTNTRKITVNGIDGVYLIKVQMEGTDYLKTIIKSNP